MAGFFVQSSNDLKSAAVIAAFQRDPEEAHLGQGALLVAAALLWCRSGESARMQSHQKGQKRSK